MLTGVQSQVGGGESGVCVCAYLRALGHSRARRHAPPGCRRRQHRQGAAPDLVPYPQSTEPGVGSVPLVVRYSAPGNGAATRVTARLLAGGRACDNERRVKTS